jgi:gliding motility-associated-like protein
LAIFLALHANLFSQENDCKNLGFELGDFTGWTFTTGRIVENVLTQKVDFLEEEPGQKGIGAVITSAFDGNDKYIYTQNVSQVGPGGNYSCRLGRNETNTGGRFYRLSTEFTVSPEHNLFLYKFAVVLQDFDNHSTVQKPGFSLKIVDQNGNSVACSEFDVQLINRSNVHKNFNIQDDLQYMNWINGAIDLQKYIGQKIKLIATAHGCTRQRHFGYAYFDAQCVKAKITQISKCLDADGQVTLRGPIGFGSYIWEDGKDEEYHKVAPILGKSYTVKMKPQYALDNTCELNLQHQVAYTKLDTTLNITLCEGEQTQVGTEKFNTTGQFTRVVSSSPICDSTVTLNLKVNKIGRHSFSKILCEGESIQVGDSVYTKTGNYTTIINRGVLCDSIVKSDLQVDKRIDANFGKKIITINKGDSLLLNTGIDIAEPYSYLWTPANLLGSLNKPVTWIKPKRSELFVVNVTNPAKSCFSTDSIFVRVVTCAIHAPDIFTPNADSHNNIFSLISGPCVAEVLSFNIYNRWGEMVYSAKNFDPTENTLGWDGTFQSQPLQADTYPYQVIYRLKEDGKLATLRHAVTLVR